MKIEYYIDNQFETRWRAVVDNGKIVAESGEGYTERRDAEHGFSVLREAIVKDYLASIDNPRDVLPEDELDIRFVARDARAQTRPGRHETAGG